MGLLLAVSMPCPAAADAEGSEQVRPDGGAVMVEMVGVYEHAQALQESLRELLGRLRLAAAFHDEPTRSPTIAHVRLEFYADIIVVTVEDAQRRTPPVRRVVPRGESAGVVRETLAHVVLGAVEPLALARSMAAPSPLTTAPPADLLAPAQPRSKPLADRTLDELRRESSSGDKAAEPGIWVTVGAGPRGLGSDRITTWVGGGALLSLPGAAEPSFFLEGGYLTPVYIEQNSIVATLQGATIRAGMRVAAIANRRLLFDVGLAPGMDVVTMEPKESDIAGWMDAPTTRAQPIASGLVGLRARVSRNFVLRLHAGLDIDIAPRHWVITRSGQDVSFFELGRVRPFAQLGLELGVAGRQTNSTEDTP